jgi:hypothetical protein
MNPSQLWHYARQFRRNRVPGQLVIQMTDRCNALCPQCGMRTTEPFQRHRLGRDQMKRIVDHAGRRRIQAISFTGGEPLLLLEDLVAMLNHAGAVGIPYIRTGTNGFVFRHPERPGFAGRVNRLAARLAATPVRNFWISIDSADPATHEKMRGFDGVIAGIERALPLFHAHGLYPSANLGINRNLGGENSIPVLPRLHSVDQAADFRAACEQGLNRFFRLTAELGFTIANVCYPMSLPEETAPGDMQAVYGATSVDAVVAFARHEKVLLFDSLARAIRANRPRLRIFAPLCSLHALKQQLAEDAFGYACRGGVDFFFVDAVQGHTFPCGYRGREDGGVFGPEDPGPAEGSPDCYQCEWECFRDPSELIGPLCELLSRPAGLLRRLRRDPPFFRCWWEDLRYYRACGFFDGRQPADMEKLGAFARAVNPMRPDRRKANGVPTLTAQHPPMDRPTALLGRDGCARRAG